MKESTIEELAYLIKEAKEQALAQPIVFLGAGASKTGGIPLAKEIIEDITSKYCRNPKVKKLLTSKEVKSYPELMECLTPHERNKLLKGYIDDAKINVTHIYLAQLMTQDYIDYVLTVNFDNLMLRALALYNEYPPTYDMAILKDLTTTTFKEKSVVYLHGQHHGLWLLNTAEEMKKVRKIVPRILDSIKDRPWIFIGYSGEDPVFEEIVKLGRFDKGLYWVTYNDNLPNTDVHKKLLEKENTNCFLIKGYDADAFMVELNNKLEATQPSIIDKPFSTLKKSLESIVDINDKDHFKGVRERLEITKGWVNTAIKLFEEGKVEAKAKMKKEIERDLLEKQMIDIIVKQEFDKNEIASLELEVKKLKNTKILNLLSSLYSEWGSMLHKLAVETSSKKLYKKSNEKFKKASKIGVPNSYIFNSWGGMTADWANLTRDETLYQHSFVQFEEAASLNSKQFNLFNNWGNALYNLAEMKNSEELYEESCSKYALANTRNSNFNDVLYNWGTALAKLAEMTGNEDFFYQCFEKYEQLIARNPKHKMVFMNWGNALSNLAEQKKDEETYLKSFDKYDAATTLNSGDSNAFYNWGNSIAKLALLKHSEELYRQSFEKYKTAVTLDHKNNYSALTNWSIALMLLGKTNKQ